MKVILANIKSIPTAYYEIAVEPEVDASKLQQQYEGGAHIELQS